MSIPYSHTNDFGQFFISLIINGIPIPLLISIIYEPQNETHLTVEERLKKLFEFIYVI